MHPAHPLTCLLAEARRGDRRAADQLIPIVYDRLRAVAGRLLGMERPGHTLDATALVNEAYLKLVDQSRAGYDDQVHFLAIAAQAMRRILVDHARTRRRQKRGGDRGRVLLDSRIVGDEATPIDALDLHELIEALHADDERAARVVELRVFGGLTVEQVARHLDISPATVARDWSYARAWLYDRMTAPDDAVGGTP